VKSFRSFELARVTPFIGAQTEAARARIVIFGCPFDGTSSFRPGARFGPAATRAVSDVLETYCPIVGRDLSEIAYADAGDLVLPAGDAQSALDLIYQMANQVHASGQIPAALGGEHLISYPLVRAAAEAHPDLAVVQFDAHMDMRDNYLGVGLSHAAVMQRISQVVKPSHILQVGQRSGTREEFEHAALLGNPKPATTTAEEIRQWVGNRPLYVTVDLDVLDPSVMPGTGTPEPGGVEFSVLQAWLTGLQGCRWVGWDVVELSPEHDPTQVSSIVCAKAVRTMLMVCTEW
jgi:agmatinase